MPTKQFYIYVYILYSAYRLLILLRPNLAAVMSLLSKMLIFLGMPPLLLIKQELYDFTDIFLSRVPPKLHYPPSFFYNCAKWDIQPACNKGKPLNTLVLLYKTLLFLLIIDYKWLHVYIVYDLFILPHFCWSLNHMTTYHKPNWTTHRPQCSCSS